jgi:MFS family permease
LQNALETDIPARLDRLPWTRFHWLFVIALGVTWVLDGLEATVVAAIGPMLLHPDALGLSVADIGLAGTVYLAGAILGALFFGHLTDRLGRKRLFTLTLLIYLTGAVLSALSWNFWSFALFRFITGLAIGGEYSAINSAVDELIPARVRGRVDLAINSTYWIGAMAGSALSLLLLNPQVLPIWLGWRICFGLGALVGLAMILARQYVPESPRWLLIHGHVQEAEAITASIESHVPDRAKLAPVEHKMKVYPGRHIGFGLILHTLLVRYRRRALLGLALIVSQAFFYNGISFTFPLVLTQFYHVQPERSGAYVFIMAISNFLGPLLLGGLFDRLGRRKMISATYAISGLLIVFTELLFLGGFLNATTQTLLWAVTFFFASAAASAGYLTVSEIFPVEMRALAIALFYAIGTALLGLGAPALFGMLVASGRAGAIAFGYCLGAALMLGAAAVEWWFGVDSEGKSLEDVSTPLSSEEPESGITPLRYDVTAGDRTAAK